MSNPLEDLGLNLPDTAENIVAPLEAKAVGAETAVGGATAAKPRSPRVEVEVGEIEVETSALESLIPLTRGGGGGATGSKYPFDKLIAPVQQADGSWGYSSFTVRLQDGVDEDALKRSVQSANTQANSKAKKANEDNRYVTRSLVEGGKFAGMKVFRVDGTIGAE